MAPMIEHHGNDGTIAVVAYSVCHAQRAHKVRQAIHGMQQIDQLLTVKKKCLVDACWMPVAAISVIPFFGPRVDT